MMSRQVKAAISLFAGVLMLSSCARDPQKAKAQYFAKGQEYMKKNQYASAAIEFQNAIKFDPRFVDAYYQLAIADSNNHEWAGAYMALQRVIDLAPDRMDARLARGQLYLAGGRFVDAEDDANSILKQEPNNAGAYQLLALALVKQQKLDEALPAFLKLVERLPNDSGAYLYLAMVETELRRLPDAEQHLKKAVASDPKSIEANHDLANFYYLNGQVSDAERVLQTAIENNPNALPLYIDWANSFAGEGKAAEADGALEKLRVQMPKSPEATIAIGDYYYQRHDNDKALAEYSRGLSVSPGHLELEKRVEDVYLSAGQTDQAAQMDTQLTKQAPKDVLVRVYHARLLMTQGKTPDAIISLQNIAKSASDSPEAHFYLGLAYWQNGNLGQARSELQAALQISPRMPAGLRSLAELDLSQGNLSSAQGYGEELVKRVPSDVSNRLLLGAIYMRQKNVHSAEAQFLLAKQLAPDQGTAYMDLGQLYFAEQKWPEAQREFERGVQLDPSNATIMSQYVEFLAARQQLSKAVAHAQQFVAANPTNSQGHLILGSLQFQAKNNDSAQSEFERAIQLDPTDVQAYLKIGRVYQAEKKTDLAIAAYNKALEVQPKFAPLSTMIGNMYLEQDDLKTAREYYQKALKGDPNFAIANANIAWIDAVEDKDLDVALGMAQKAKSEMPDVPSITDTLGWVMVKKGNYSGAIPLLQECVQKAPNSAQYHYHLGMAFVGSGQKAKGKAQLQAALQMNQLKASDAEAVRQALVQID